MPHSLRPGYLRPSTKISNWLALARRLFDIRPDAIHHALLLADGKNESEEGTRLSAELERCVAWMRGTSLAR